MEWSSKKCQPCEGIGSALSSEEIKKQLKELTGWSYDNQTKSIKAHFKFKNFLNTMSFVNAIAYLAEQEGHHPDLEVSYGHSNVSLTTHALGGVSENDFILASKINLLRKPNE